MAELSRPPVPARVYPVVVVGSGPGGLQISYALSRLGIDHAVLSADEAPGGMFRRWPFFQRCCRGRSPSRRPSTDAGVRALRLEQPARRRARAPGAACRTLMDGASYFPSRPEMEENLALFAERTGIAIRHGCRWTGTRTRRRGRLRRSSSRRPTANTALRLPIFAVGVAEPARPTAPGIELAHHYADVRPGRDLRRQARLHHRQAELRVRARDGLLQWARQIVLASPSPAKLSVNTRSLVGVRARYVQPYRGPRARRRRRRSWTRRSVASSAWRRRFEVLVQPTDGGDEIRFEVDEVIAATGFMRPLLDLPDLGVHDVRPEPAAGGDAVLGERFGARALLRRDVRRRPRG